MPLKLYGNLLSQPVRAVFLFLKANGIPYEFKFVDIAKGMLLSVGCDNFSYIIML
jgi:glutathione S-transferase